MSPLSSNIARWQYSSTAVMSWVTKTTVRSEPRISWKTSLHFCWKAASPTASTSSIRRISASDWIMIAKASRTSIPEE